MIRLHMALVASVVMLAGPSCLAWSSEAKATPVPEASRFESAPCDLAEAPAGWAVQNGVTCGRVRVPVRRDDPGLGFLRLWVVKVAAKHDSGRPPVIRVLGGPEAIRFAYLAGTRTQRLRANHDIVFFDYRGLGRSEPALSCKVEPVSGRTPDQRLELKLGQYAACRKQIDAAGVDLSGITSRDNARDIDDIARALGYARYYVNGASYGSVVMLELIRMHPEGLGAAVIGTPFPPNTPLHDTVSTFALALAQIQAECNRAPTCAQRFPDLANTLNEGMDRFEREHLSHDKRRLLPFDLFASLWGLMFDVDFTRVPSAIDFAAHGDAALVAQWVGATSDGADFFLPELRDATSIVSATVNCADIAKGRPIAPDLRAAVRRYPYLANAVVPADGFDRLCATLRHSSPAADARDAVSGDLPVLMYSLRFDPTTTQSDARLAAETLPHATLLEHPGGTHMSLIQDPCLIDLEAAFFEDPSVDLDRSCTAGWRSAEFALDGFKDYIVSLQAH